MAQRITAPVLLISGTRSTAFFHRIAERLSACLVRDRLAMIVALHTLPGENPAVFQQELLSLLQQQRRSS